MLVLAALFVLALSARADEAAHRLPVLSSLFPQGARAGATTRVEILGQHLDRASALVSHSRQLSGRIVAVEATRLVVDLTVAADATPGHHQFRVITPRGPSNIVLFRAGDQPHTAESEPNDSLAGAQRVAVPVTINGRLPRDEEYDFYRFAARAGETWILEVRAARNGNSLDAALVLLDSRGRKLAHDEDTFIWDPFIAHTFAADGEYVAVVQPTHASNDAGFAYQLDIRRAPHLETVSPISLRPGFRGEITLHGKGLAGSTADLVFSRDGVSGRVTQMRGDSALATIEVSPSAPPGPVELRVAAHGLSSPATILIDDAAPFERGAAITAPVAINGTARYREPERYRFRAESGQMLRFEVRAQRYGAPVDSVLRILDAAGNQIVKNDDGGFPGAVFNKDSLIEHRFEEGGEYEVEIRNLWAVTGENFPYQLRIEPARPRVDLLLAADRSYVYSGKTARIKLDVVRSGGHKDAVPLEVSGLPAGFVAKAAVVAAESKSAEIEIEASAAAAAGGYGPITVTANGTRAYSTVQVSSGGGEGRAWTRVEGATLAVAEEPAFALECAARSLNLVRGGRVQLKVMISRREGINERIVFDAGNLPGGVTVATVDAGVDTATLEFSASPEAELGRSTRVSVFGTAAGQTNEAPKISLVVD